MGRLLVFAVFFGFFGALLFECGSIKAVDYFVNCGVGNDSRDGLSEVWDGVHGPKATIQAGIEAANFGDRVITAVGIYTGSGNRDLDFRGKPLILRSSNPGDPDVVAATIIDVNGSRCEPHRGIVFHCYEDANSIVEGFTITNGFMWGGGVYCIQSSPTIRHCVLKNNATISAGGAIHCNNSSPVISDCTIIANTAGSVGGGIYCDKGSAPIISNCVISDNSANNGGGIYCAIRSRPQIISCLIVGNFAMGQNPKLSYKGGGGCAESDCEIAISACTVSGNYAASFGGGVYLRDSSMEAYNCVVAGNVAGVYGGGIYCNRSSTVIKNASFSANSARSRGGAIRLYNRSSVWASNSVFWGNTIVAEETGHEMALAKESLLATFYSNVQDGAGTIVRELDCSLDWEAGNIDVCPHFVREGYWDTNEPIPNPDEDYWVAGDYHLRSEGWRWDAGGQTWIQDGVTSRCIDAGNPGINPGDELLKDLIEPVERVRLNPRINMGAYGGTTWASIGPLGWSFLGDLNNDGIVNREDGRILIDKWQDKEERHPGDLNRDNVVDITDFTIMAENWLKSTSWYS